MKFDKDRAQGAVREIIQQYVFGNITLAKCAETINFIYMQEIRRLEAEIEEIEESHIVGGGWGWL